MERINFAVKDGVVRLPPGFRFHPTDEELVVHYLCRKVFSCPLPASVIPELNVYKYDPWELPGDSSEVRYFFCIREVRYPGGNPSARATSSGFWKAIGAEKQIVALQINQVVGMKKLAVFHHGKPQKGSRLTDWIMLEYRLLDSIMNGRYIVPKAKNSTQKAIMKMKDWVVCCIFLKKSSGRNNVDINHPSNYRAWNFVESESSSDSSSVSDDETSSVGSCNE